MPVQEERDAKEHHMTHDPAPLPDQEDGAPAKQHGDPLLAAAEGRGSGDDGSRHGYDATAASRQSREAGGDEGDGAASPA